MNLLNKYTSIFIRVYDIYRIIYIIILLHLGKLVGHALHDLHALTARHCYTKCN